MQFAKITKSSCMLCLKGHFILMRTFSYKGYKTGHFVILCLFLSPTLAKGDGRISLQNNHLILKFLMSVQRNHEELLVVIKVLAKNAKGSIVPIKTLKKTTGWVMADWALLVEIVLFRHIILRYVKLQSGSTPIIKIAF